MQSVMFLSKDCQLLHQREVLEKSGPSLYVGVLLAEKMNANLQMKCMNIWLTGFIIA